MALKDPIAGFLVRTLLLYGALCIPWPGLQTAYSVVYRRVAAVLFGSFGQNGVVEFSPAPDAIGAVDTEIIIRNRASGSFAVSPHAPRRAAYLPTVVVTALVLATPLPWPRRWRSLLWALAGVHAYVALRLAVTIAHGFDGTAPWCLYSLPAFWSGVLAVAYEILAASPTTPFLVAVLVWAVVTFRSGGLRVLAPPAGRPDVHS